MSRLQLRQLTADRTALFSLPVPSGWSADRSGREGSSVVIFSPTVEDNFRANVNVVVQDLAPLAQEEYLTLSRLQLRKLSNMATLPVDEPFQRLPGGHVFEWVTWEAPIPVRGRQLLVFQDGKAFIVTAMATAGSFERHKPTFDAVLESFEVRQVMQRGGSPASRRRGCMAPARRRFHDNVSVVGFADCLHTTSPLLAARLPSGCFAV